ncbi:MAG: hypothetical protein MSB80_05995 [Alphaproteobacteria bacterium]|nr:hypothetical protein [Alphaproteobacteria bacterium]
MNNMYNTVSVENASIVLNSLKSLNRPLTAEEKLAGRKAALFIGQDIKDKIKASQEEEVKYLMERGYTAQEAREKIRLEDFARAESVGLGVSKKCRFRKRKAC